MTNYTIHFYGVYFSNNTDSDEVVEPISVQEFNDLVSGDCDTFYDAFSTIRKRVEERFGLKVEGVSDWDVIEHK